MTAPNLFGHDLLIGALALVAVCGVLAALWVSGKRHTARLRADKARREWWDNGEGEGTC